MWTGSENLYTESKFFYIGYIKMGQNMPWGLGYMCHFLAQEYWRSLLTKKTYYSKHGSSLRFKGKTHQMSLILTLK